MNWGSIVGGQLLILCIQFKMEAYMLGKFNVTKSVFYNSEGM